MHANQGVERLKTALPQGWDVVCLHTTVASLSCPYTRSWLSSCVLVFAHIGDKQGQSQESVPIESNRVSPEVMGEGKRETGRGRWGRPSARLFTPPPSRPCWQTLPGDNPGGNKWFLQSTPIQMLPPGGSICGRLT